MRCACVSPLPVHLDTRLLPCLGCCGPAAVRAAARVSSFELEFSRYMPRSGIAGSHGSSGFVFLRDLHVLLHAAAPVHVPTCRTQGSPSPHPLQHLFLVDLLMMTCSSDQARLLLQFDSRFSACSLGCAASLLWHTDSLVAACGLSRSPDRGSNPAPPRAERDAFATGPPVLSAAANMCRASSRISSCMCVPPHTPAAVSMCVIPPTSLLMDGNSRLVSRRPLSEPRCPGGEGSTCVSHVRLPKDAGGSQGPCPSPTRTTFGTKPRHAIAKSKPGQ